MGDFGQQFPGGSTGGNGPRAPSGSGLYRSAQPSSNIPPDPDDFWDEIRERMPKVLMALAAFALLALLVTAVLVANRPKPKTTGDDWGAGVFNAAGLRGHLVTQWAGKAQYKLEIKPLDPQGNAQFAYVAANPPGPLYLNIRLLDQSGFAVCGKQVLFAFDPAKTAPAAIPGPGPRARKAVAERVAQAQAAQKAELQSQQAQEQARERGNDIFQNQLGDDGKIVAVNAQGTLPCSGQEYKRIYYWDFATNFPTVDEQDALMHHVKEAQARREYEERMAQRRRNTVRMASAFYIEGEDRITGYDASRELLGTADGKSFFIARKNDQGVAVSWAAESALIHYKCDQHAACALKHAGTVTVISGRLNE